MIPDDISAKILDIVKRVALLAVNKHPEEYNQACDILEWFKSQPTMPVPDWTQAPPEMR